MKKLLFAIAVLFLSACSASNIEPVPTAIPGAQTEASDGNDAILEAGCLAQKGTWVASASECEGISQEMCEDLGGKFNECASACRNQPEAEMCTLQCVLVCEF